MEDQESKLNDETADQSEHKGPLYHYTDQKGLLGILESKEIWATHIRYLNDTNEGQIAIRLIWDEFINRYDLGPMFETFGVRWDKGANRNEPADEDILNRGLGVAQWVTSQSVFVTSFSKKGDSLSQWRAYSGKSGGYSIGFKPDYLEAVGTNFLKGRADTFYSDTKPLSRCVYVDEQVESSLKDEIKAVVTDYVTKADLIKKSPEEGTNGFQSVDALAVRSFIDLGRRSAFLKDIGFLEESEWRLAFLLNQNSIPPDLSLYPSG